MFCTPPWCLFGLIRAHAQENDPSRYLGCPTLVVLLQSHRVITLGGCRVICSFATKNSVHLGRFRVKNATVRAGKRVHYGLRLYTRLFGVRNATVWGYFCDFMGFCNIMFEVVFLFFAF